MERRSSPGIRLIGSVALAVACVALLGVGGPVLSRLAAPFLVIGIVIAASTAWRAVCDLETELEEVDGELTDPVEYWGVAGWPAPRDTAPEGRPARRSTRAEARQLVADIEEYLARDADGR